MLLYLVFCRRIRSCIIASKPQIPAKLITALPQFRCHSFRLSKYWMYPASHYSAGADDSRNNTSSSSSYSIWFLVYRLNYVHVVLPSNIHVEWSTSADYRSPWAWRAIDGASNTTQRAALYTMPYYIVLPFPASQTYENSSRVSSLISPRTLILPF